MDPKKANQPAKAAIDNVVIDEDYLVTYREFMIALKSLKDTLYKTLMPRTLSFQDVLNSSPVEKTYEVSDMQIDDFYLFRYEMNTIFQKHLFQDEGKSDFLLGKKPLSKVQGVPVKEMVESLRSKKDNFKGNLYDNLNRKCQEIYVPPGVVKLTPTVFEKEVKVRDEIRLA